MNILITSIGTRGYLIDHFKNSLGDDYGIFAADASKYAPALYKADQAFIIPRADDKDYCSSLLKICEDNNVKIIISINDLELNYLSRYKKVFLERGIHVIISSEDVIELCFDKYLTYKFCIKNNIPVPRTYVWNNITDIDTDLNSNIIKFPLIAKPRRGSRSVGIQIINDYDELIEIINKMKRINIPENQKHIIQEYINSDKFSIHVFNDENNTPNMVVGMVNIFRNLGETFHIKTIDNNELIKLGKDIGLKLKHLGPLSADVHQKESGEFIVLEFNPRISGCYSLSHYAGADFPKRIVNLVEKNLFNLTDFHYEKDIIMLKQFTTSFFTENEIDKKIKLS